MRLAYLVSRFPALSETFVVREILEIQRLGHEVQVYSLKSNPDAGYDEAAEEIVGKTEYCPFFLSTGLLWANIETAIRRPLRYWGTLLFVLFHGMGRRAYSLVQQCFARHDLAKQLETVLASACRALADGLRPIAAALG